MKLSPWVETLADGTAITIRPLTIRERIAVTDEMADEWARSAAKDAKAAQLLPAQIADAMADARKRASVSSALILDCYTLRGALRVLDRASSDGVALASSLEAIPLTELALQAIGFETRRERESTDAGNALAV